MSDTKLPRPVSQAQGTVMRGAKKELPKHPAMIEQEKLVDELSEKHRVLRNSRPSHDAELMRVADEYTAANVKLSAMCNILAAQLTPEEQAALQSLTPEPRRK